MKNLKRDLKRVQKIDGLIKQIMRAEKTLAKGRGKRPLTDTERLNLQVHFHYMWRTLEQLQTSLEKFP